MASSSRPAPAPRHVLALFGPTASGKTAVAGILRGTPRRRGRSPPTRLRSTPASRSSLRLRTTRRGSSASSRSRRTCRSARYQQLAHEAIDEIARPARRRRHGPVLPRRAVGARASRRRGAVPIGRPRSSGSARRRRTPCSPSGTRAAAARVHANDRRRVVRALELAEAGHSLAPADDRLWTDDTRPPDDDRRARAAARRARPAHRGANERDGRARAPRGGGARLGEPALGDGTEGARPRGVRDPAGGRRSRARDRRDAAARALSAQVAAAACRRRYARREPASGGDRR